MTIKQAIEFRKKIEQASAWTSDADALEMIELFPVWGTGKSYIVGERIQYKSLLYKCVQAHTSQDDWTPDKTPALWVRVFVEEFPEWIQPQGAADAYMIGDKVTFEGKHYISLIDGNVWSPAVYPQGWDEIVETEEDNKEDEDVIEEEAEGDNTGEETETDSEDEQPQSQEPQEEEYPLWIQPTGVSDAYNTGDRVIFENQVYESLIDGNVWSPTDYPMGWSLIN